MYIFRYMEMYSYTRWQYFQQALHAVDEDTDNPALMPCYKRCFEAVERAWQDEKDASSRRRPPLNFFYMAYLRERLRQRLTGKPFRTAFADLSSPNNQRQQHRLWRRCCLRLGWEVLAPHDPRERKAARKIQRVFRKYILISRARANISAVCTAFALPAHIHDEIIRQYFST